MAKKMNDIIVDTGFNVIKTGITSYGPANRMSCCTAEPVSAAEAASLACCIVTMASGDFTIADDTSGRKVTVAAKSSQVITASGTVNHIALYDTVNAVLLYVTTCTSQALVDNDSNTVSFPAWKINIGDPT
jgi:hypothetical protein